MGHGQRASAAGAAAGFDWAEIGAALRAQVRQPDLELDRAWTERCASAVARGELSSAANCLREPPEPAAAGDAESLAELPPAERTALAARGRALLEQGAVAVVVLNG